jgi:soluble lytic murein transglycosylase-like protein
MSLLFNNPSRRWNVLWTALLALSLAIAIFVDDTVSRPSVMASKHVSTSRHGLIIRVRQILRQEGRNISAADQRDIANTLLRISRKNRVDPLLVLSVIKVESSFRPEVVSYAGAIGLMQVKPVVVRELAVNNTAFPSVRSLLKDPHANIEVGIRYLSYLRERFGEHNWYHVLAAYNMGPTLVRRTVRRQKSPSRRYYAKVMKVYRGYQSSQRPETI